MIMKAKRNYLKIVVTILFVAFIALYFACKNGYYDYNQYNKMNITKEAMERFEKDVSEGKNIEIKDYLETTYRDYSNNVSKLGLKAGEVVEKIMNKGIGKTVKFLEALFTN